MNPADRQIVEVFEPDLVRYYDNVYPTDDLIARINEQFAIRFLAAVNAVATQARTRAGRQPTRQRREEAIQNAKLPKDLTGNVYKDLLRIRMHYVRHQHDVQLLDALLQEIIQIFAQYGYVLHYFDFVNKNSPYYLAQTGQLPLTPENFELAQTLIPATRYSDMIDIIQHQGLPPDKYYIKFYGQNLTVRQAHEIRLRTIHNAQIMEETQSLADDSYAPPLVIHDALTAQAITFRNVAEKDAYVPINTAYRQETRSGQYWSKARGLGGSDHRALNKDLTQARDQVLDRVEKGIKVGWRKRDLVEAIRRSGIPMIDVTRGFGNEDEDQVVIGQAPASNGIGLPPIRRLPGLQPYQLNPGSRIRKALPGFGSTSYMSRNYYETLYRKIYNTLKYVNWPLMCQYQRLSLSE